MKCGKNASKRYYPRFHLAITLYARFHLNFDLLSLGLTQLFPNWQEHFAQSRHIVLQASCKAKSVESCISHFSYVTL